MSQKGAVKALWRLDKISRYFNQFLICFNLKSSNPHKRRYSNFLFGVFLGNLGIL